MAREMIFALTDDVTGGQADETVTFSLDGVNYEIDLSEENAAQLRGDLATWVERGRRIGGRRPRTDSPGQNILIRRWAKDHGYGIGDRGRIPKSVREAYDAAH